MMRSRRTLVPVGLLLVLVAALATPALAASGASDTPFCLCDGRREWRPA